MFVDAGSIYLHRDAVDFRKSINGLVIIVEQEMELSPFAPALFVFCNKNRDRSQGAVLGPDRVLPVVQAPGEGEVQVAAPVSFGVSDDAELNDLQWEWLLSGYDIIGHEPLKYAHCVG